MLMRTTATKQEHIQYKTKKTLMWCQCQLCRSIQKKIESALLL